MDGPEQEPKLERAAQGASILIGRPRDINADEPDNNRFKFVKMR